MARIYRAMNLLASTLQKPSVLLTVEGAEVAEQFVAMAS
jgi:hypothetical protein